MSCRWHSGEEELGDGEEEEEGFNDEMDLVMVRPQPCSSAAQSLDPMRDKRIALHKPCRHIWCRGWAFPHQAAMMVALPACKEPSSCCLHRRMKITTMMRATWMTTMAEMERASSEARPGAMLMHANLTTVEQERMF